jgi:hypothetical protein
MNTPKWVNPVRQNYLVGLWLKHGNRCRLGHLNCAIASHYAVSESKLVRVINGKDFKCYDSSGNLLLDRFGNPTIRHTFEIKTQRIDFKLVQIVTNDDGLEHYRSQYEIESDKLVKDWSQSERENTLALNRYEYDIRHNLKDRLPLRGQFSGIAQEVYYDNCSMYKVESIGIDGLTFKPFAKIRLTSSGDCLYVDLTDCLKGLSAHKRRKILRYAKNDTLSNYIDTACNQAVKDYLS